MNHPTIYKIGALVLEGGFAIDYTLPNGTFVTPRSSAFVCNTCGQAWGWIKVGGMGFQATHRPCEQHGDGRMLTGINLSQFKEIPSKVLRREILLYYRNPKLGDK